MRFSIDGREYAGASALDIVRAMQRAAACGVPACVSPRVFLRAAHDALRGRVPERELDVSDRLDEETLALGYLYLCDEYGVGELSDTSPVAPGHVA